MIVALFVITAALTVGFFHRPTWGLAALIAALPLENLGTISVGATVRPSQIIGLALIAAWAMRLLAQRTTFRQITAWRYLLLFAVSAGIAAASVHYSTTWENWLILLFYCALFFVVAQLTEPKTLPLIFKALFASALAVSLFGLYQYLGDVMGLPVALTGLKIGYTKAVFGYPRIQSTELEPLFFANYLLLPLFVGLATWWQGNIRAKWWHYTGFAVIGLAFVLTTSRGAFLAAGVGFGALLIAQLVRVWNPKIILASVGTLVLLVIIGGGLLGLSTYQNQGNFLQSLKTFVSTNLNFGQSPSFVERSNQVKIGQSLVRAKQPFGIGLGGIGPRLAGYPHPATAKFVALNSEGLELVIQTGYVGYLLFAAFIVALLAAAWIKSPVASPVRGWILGLAAAIIATIAQAQTFSGFFLTHRWVELGLLAGLVSYPKTFKFTLTNLKRLI